MARRTEMFQLRLTTAELERLQHAADQQKLSMSEVIRDLIKLHLPHPAHVLRNRSHEN